jgi:hypothetical protein
MFEGKKKNNFQLRKFLIEKSDQSRGKSFKIHRHLIGYQEKFIVAVLINFPMSKGDKISLPQEYNL